jgi:hypothetical protein
VSHFRDEGSALDGILWGCLFLVVLAICLALTVWILGEAGVIRP